MRGSTTGGMVFHVAAPIRIGGRDFVLGVLVKSDENTKLVYVHEAVLKEKLQRSEFKIGAVAAETGKRADSDARAVLSLL